MCGWSLFRYRTSFWAVGRIFLKIGAFCFLVEELGGLKIKLQLSQIRSTTWACFPRLATPRKRQTFFRLHIAAITASSMTVPSFLYIFQV